MFTLCVQGIPRIATQFELQFFHTGLLIIYFGMFTRYISNSKKQWFLMFLNIVYFIDSIDKRHFLRHKPELSFVHVLVGKRI